MATTDQTLAVEQQVTYGTWGDELSVSQPSGYHQRMRWKGALSLQPEIGLVYLRARWYDPDLGRFSSEDPIGLAAGINAYTFGGGDPINRADPTGKCVPWCLEIAWGVGYSVFTGIITHLALGEPYTLGDFAYDLGIGFIDGLFGGTVKFVGGMRNVSFGADGLRVLRWSDRGLSTVLTGASVGAAVSEAHRTSSGGHRSSSGGTGGGHHGGGGTGARGETGGVFWGPSDGFFTGGGTWTNPDCAPVITLTVNTITGETIGGTTYYPCSGVTITWKFGDQTRTTL